MTWFQINNRIFELEAKEYLTSEEIEEWNKLVTSKVAGILIRNEKDNRETKTETKREESV